MSSEVKSNLIVLKREWERSWYESYEPMIVGKVLTILDATLPPGPQCDAAKDVTREQLYQTLNRVPEGLGLLLLALANHTGDQDYLDIVQTGRIEPAIYVPWMEEKR